jgi:hypothetical protein
MVINCECANITSHDLVTFLKENEFTGHRLRLLLFWGKHPQAKFSLECIAHVLDVTHFHLRELLRDLINKGIVEENYSPSGIAHYSFNSGHALGDYIRELTQYDWSAVRNLEWQAEREPVLAS